MDLVSVLFPPGIFTLSFMQNAWIAGSAVAVASGLVGFFVMVRGASFVAHAVPRASFAGAAGAVLIGQSNLLGLALFAVLSSLGIAGLKRGRQSGIATALVLVGALGLGDLFLSIGNVYAPEVFGLLFGQIVGISRNEVFAVLALTVAILLTVGLCYRPLLAQAVTPDTVAALGLRSRMVDTLFLLLVSGVATATVPVVGALLSFSLMVGPAAAASLFARRPITALWLGVGLSLASLWIAIWISYLTSWPVSFFVSAVAMLLYLSARFYAKRRHRRAALPQVFLTRDVSA
jgi:zinc/manganese transport system permease protein